MSRVLPREKRRENASKTITIILAITLGIVGAHKFYIGEYKQGLFWLLFFWTGIPMLVGWFHAIRYAFFIDDWDDYLDSQSNVEKQVDKKIRKKEREKRRKSNWRDKNKYTIIDKYKKETGSLTIEEWTDGNSEVDGSIDIDGGSKGKSRGLIIGPFTGSKSKSSMSAKGDISASISNNSFTAEIQTLVIRDENLKLDSDVIEFDMDFSEIDRVYKTNDGFVVKSGGTTFRIGDLPKGSSINRIVSYIEKNRSDQPTDFESKSDSSEKSDKELTEKLEELEELKEKGVLSDEEFESKKENLIEDF